LEEIDMAKILYGRINEGIICNGEVGPLRGMIIEDLHLEHSNYYIISEDNTLGGF
jgi:hypothetical protein